MFYYRKLTLHEVYASFKTSRYFQSYIKISLKFNFCVLNEVNPNFRNSCFLINLTKRFLYLAYFNLQVHLLQDFKFPLVVTRFLEIRFTSSQRSTKGFFVCHHFLIHVNVLINYFGQFCSFICVNSF